MGCHKHPSCRHNVFVISYEIMRSNKQITPLIQSGQYLHGWEWIITEAIQLDVNFSSGNGVWSQQEKLDAVDYETKECIVKYSITYYKKHGSLLGRLVMPVMVSFLIFFQESYHTSLDVSCSERHYKPLNIVNKSITNSYIIRWSCRSWVRGGDWIQESIWV